MSCEGSLSWCKGKRGNEEIERQRGKHEKHAPNSSLPTFQERDELGGL